MTTSSTTAAVPRKLWEHPSPQNTPMWRFMQAVNKKHGLQLKTFQDLHRFSIMQRAQFWAAVFEAAGFLHSGRYTRVVDESAPIDAVPRWFDGVALNFAENMLLPHGGNLAGVDFNDGGRTKADAATAVTEVREGASTTRHVSWAQLRERTGRLAAAMRARGIGKGDRVVAVGANSVETLLVWLATAWLGAVFSSSSTDTGVAGILQRTVQVDPKLLFMDDTAVYNGKVTDLRPKMADVVRGLRDGCRSFLGAVAIPRFADEPRDVSNVPLTEPWADFLARGRGQPRPEFVRIAFHEPALICYSSGTTGTPKAIVHSVGGAMINSFKESRLHEGTSADSTAMQYTTTGWIMYLAAVVPLMVGARVVLYDGSPFVPDPRVLLRVAERERATKIGASPRWMLELKKAGIVPRDAFDLTSLRILTSTGMVLSDELFAWFYDTGFPRAVQLGNISGGTDIAGCFGIMNPLTPVYVGGTQGPSLGVHVAIYDSMLTDKGPGHAVPDGTPGELVAISAFPNVPCKFWGDGTSSPGPRYRAAYFERFDHAWAHGDFCSVHPATGNIAFLGRADGVLNPSGVRFGSAEIYGVVERHFADRVHDSLCVGQRRPTDPDESVMLFLMMKPGCAFDKGLVAEVRDAIRRDLSKRHVPRYVFATPEIPVTTTMKKIEIAVKHIVSGRTVKPSGAVANPGSLDYYYQFARVEELVGPKEKL